MDESEGNQCVIDCENNGVCLDGKCYCAAGYFGGHCQHTGKANQFYEAVEEEPIPDEPEPDAEPVKTDTKSHHGLGFFGWYFMLFLISLILAAILAAVAYFFFKKDVENLVKPKDKDQKGKENEMKPDDSKNDLMHDHSIHHSHDDSKNNLEDHKDDHAHNTEHKDDFKEDHKGEQPSLDDKDKKDDTVDTNIVRYEKDRVDDK